MLSEKHSAKIAREIVECSARLRGAKRVSFGVMPAVEGVGSASSSTSSCAAEVKGSVSSDRPWRSLYRLRKRYFRAERKIVALAEVIVKC